MASIILRIAVLIGWLFWYVVYWRFGADIQRSIRNAASTIERWLLIAMGALTIVMALGSFALAVGWISVPSRWFVTAAGTALFLVGMGGTFYCRSYLGKYWRAESAVNAENTIVDRGPYGLVRHPIYTAAITMYFGLALVFPVWWVVVAGLLCMGAYVWKTAFEDRFLAEHLPGYVEYQGRVRARLVPRLW